MGLTPGSAPHWRPERGRASRGGCQASYLVARCRPHQLGLRRHQPRGVQLPRGPLGGQRWTVHIDAQGSLLLAFCMHHMEKE